MTKVTLKVKKGVVVSDKMDKTVVVQIDRILTHPIYQKKYVVSKNYKAHDDKNEFKVGDIVEIAGVAPISKDKKYKVVKLASTKGGKQK